VFLFAARENNTSPHLVGLHNSGFPLCLGGEKQTQDPSAAALCSLPLDDNCFRS
jgi:hypothetical protein